MAEGVVPVGVGDSEKVEEPSRQQPFACSQQQKHRCNKAPGQRLASTPVAKRPQRYPKNQQKAELWFEGRKRENYACETQMLRPKQTDCGRQQSRRNQAQILQPDSLRGREAAQGEKREREQLNPGQVEMKATQPEPKTCQCHQYRHKKKDRLNRGEGQEDGRP